MTVSAPSVAGQLTPPLAPRLIRNAAPPGGLADHEDAHRLRAQGSSTGHLPDDWFPRSYRSDVQILPPLDGLAELNRERLDVSGGVYAS